MKRNKSKWKYSNQQTIEEILRQENVQTSSQETQREILIRKINTAMMYYIKTKCENYHFIVGKTNHKEKRFIYINRIIKNEKIIFNVENLNIPTDGKRNNILRHQRMFQCLKLSEIISLEKKIQFVFNDSVRYFEIVCILDENENEIDLKQFLNEFECCENLIDLIEVEKQNKTNENEISKEMEIINMNGNEKQNELKKIEMKDKKEIKWKYHQQNVIHQILTNENVLHESQKTQRSILLRKINCAMMFYLLIECTNYEIDVNKSSTSNRLLYINSITKDNELLFSIETFQDDLKEMKNTQKDNLRRKLQMIKMSELIQKEKGIHFVFNESIASFELIKIMNEQTNEMIDLQQFLNEYEKYDELFEILSNQRNQNKVNSSTKWLYHDNKAIEQLLEDENAQMKTKMIQIAIIIKKINIAMIYYLLTECEGYFITINRHLGSSFFKYIQKIMKNNIVVYSIDEFEDEMKEGSSKKGEFIKRRKQIQRMAELIFKENKIQFVFNSSTTLFELVNIIDIDGKEIDLIEFLKKYENEEKVNEIIMNQTKIMDYVTMEEENETNTINEFNEKKELNETMKSKTFYQTKVLEWLNQNKQFITTILQEENALTMKKESQISIILRKVNCAMIYFLQTQCKGYSIEIHQIRTKQMIYIEKIMKENVIVYDYQKYINELKEMNLRQANCIRRKIQMERLAELIQLECGIKFLFNGKVYSFDLISITDKNDSLILLNDFLEKYEKYDELIVPSLNNPPIQPTPQKRVYEISQINLNFDFNNCNHSKEEIEEIDKQNEINTLKETQDNLNKMEEQNETHQENKMEEEIEIHQETNFNSQTKHNSKWKFQTPQSIDEILFVENALDKSKQSQNRIIINKINCAMICYLLTKCNDYSFDLVETSIIESLYINTIKHGNEIVYDINNFQDELKNLSKSYQNQMRRKIQMDIMTVLIEKESGIKFTFYDSVSMFEIVSLIDTNGELYDLIDFLNEFEDYIKVRNIVFEKNNKENINEQREEINHQEDENIKEIKEQNKRKSKSMDIMDEEELDFENIQQNESYFFNENDFNKQNDELNDNTDEKESNSKWLFHDPSAIEEILIFENVQNKSEQTQRKLIMKKINCAMIYYLITQCEGYRFDVIQTKQNRNLFINTIEKDEEIVYDINELSDKFQSSKPSQIEFIKRKLQMECMSELIENESEMKFVFNDDIKTFELVTIVDKYQNKLDLIDFLNSYERWDEVFELLSQQNLENEIEIPKEVQTKEERKNTNKKDLKMRNEEKQNNQNNNEMDEEIEPPNLITSFNNALIAIMNKLKYKITFINPQYIPFNDDSFLWIKSIQKEGDDEKIYSNESLLTMNKQMIDKYNQINAMIMIIECDTIIYFLFEINDLKENSQPDKFMIKVNDERITMDEFNDKYINENIIEHIWTNFNLFDEIEWYQMTQFMKIKRNEFLLRNKSLWKSNIERVIDEWKRILIYHLYSLEYQIIFTKESMNYLNVIKQLQLEQNEENKENGNKDQIKEFLKENDLMIESIEKNDKKFKFSQLKEVQMKELITIVNEESEYEIITVEIHQENKSIQIPRYFKKKLIEEKEKRNISNRYLSTDFLYQYDVNHIIEELLMKQKDICSKELNENDEEEREMENEINNRIENRDSQINSEQINETNQLYYSQLNEILQNQFIQQYQNTFENNPELNQTNNNQLTNEQLQQLLLMNQIIQTMQFQQIQQNNQIGEINQFNKEAILNLYNQMNQLNQLNEPIEMNEIDQQNPSIQCILGNDNTQSGIASQLNQNDNDKISFPTNYLSKRFSNEEENEDTSNDLDSNNSKNQHDSE